MPKWPKSKTPLAALPVLSLRRFIKERCGPLIGDGLYRDVYEYKLDPCFVIKIERDPSTGAFANVAEWLNWCNNMDDQTLGPYLCPIAEIDETGQILLMRRARFPEHSTYPNRLPSAFTDQKYSNFGVVGKRFVCVDYSFLLPVRGRMRKAEWWDVKT